jgi:DNA-binding transcriptional ArsR family regulator
VLALSLDAGEIGLRSLFGMARTSGEKASRPPLDRLRIFRELLRADSVQVSEARDVMGISQNAASRALLWLDASEIVDYESMAPQSIADQLTYTFPENFELPSGQAEVKQMVYDLLAELVAEGRQHSLGGILSALRSRYPDQGFDGQSRRTYTIGLMNRLVKAGSITKNMDGKRRRSTITLREEARPIIERTVAIADGMLEEDDDFLREGRQELRVILSDPERVRTLVGKAFKASPEANGLPFADRYSHVAAVLRGRAGTSSEIAEAVKAHGMTLASTQNTLEVMRRRGLAIAERVPGFSANRWELIEASPVAA